MGKLVLDSLEIKNFRTFKHLTIERLGRVNLIVGRNNVGKTSLLEALLLYSRQGLPFYIWELLEDRDEGKHVLREKRLNFQEQAAAIKYLFNGRKEISIGNVPEAIKIGSKDKPDEVLSIAVNWFLAQSNGVINAKPLSNFSDLENVASPDDLVLGFSLQTGQNGKVVYRADSKALVVLYPPLKQILCEFIPIGGLTSRQVTIYWDRIALTPEEDDVIKTLRLILPELERINLVSNGDDVEDRIPLVKINQFSSPIPLRSLGGGITHLFELAIALVNAKDGILLVDEIDNGLHYSVLTDVWKLIFETAHRLNVQVFATTHSWECIEAFQKAAEENAQEEGLLIRLQNKKGEVVPTIFDERRLAIVTREQIEVR